MPMISSIFLLAGLAISFVFGLDNGLARTPPMGWMSWTAFYCERDCVRHPNACINEELYKQMADRMAQDGWLAAGYKSVHVDDCWMAKERDAKGRLQSDPDRFPSGMKALAKYMHDRGLLFGIYEDFGTNTCEGYPGSLDHLEIDAQTFADWEADYLKFDGCNVDKDLMPIGYPQMARALNATGRPIVYAIEWPWYFVNTPEKINYTIVAASSNVFRNYADVERKWSSILSIIAYNDLMQDKQIPSNGPGHWFDPDMLIAGLPEFTPDMARAQMTIWSIWSAPLIMSNDLRNLAPVYRDILLNPAVIAVDQDPLGKMGRLVANTTDVGVYVKPMTPVDPVTGETSYAIALLNRNERKANEVEFLLGQLGLTSPGGYRLDDLWAHRLVGIFKKNDPIKTYIAPACANLFKATPVSLTHKKTKSKAVNKKKGNYRNMVLDG